MRRPALSVACVLAVALIACASESPATPTATDTATPEATTLPSEPVPTVGTGTVTPGVTVTAVVVTVTPAPPGSTPAPSPTVTVDRLTNVGLKYLLFDRFGELWYCDPDYWPIARADEGDLAEQHLPGIRQDTDTFMAILAHLGYPNAPAYTRDQTLTIYRQWKMLRALTLEAAGNAFRFEARFTRDGGQSGVLASGTIDAVGRITVTSEATSGRPMCPICLARGTLIATPSGPVPVEEMREGMAVWTQAPDGSRVAGVVLAVGSMRAPAEHEVVRLALDDGRVLRASPGHPLADGRALGDLAPGDRIDGAHVVEAMRMPYGGSTTFDVLPSGATGEYWADGVPLTSTLGAS